MAFEVQAAEWIFRGRAVNLRVDTVRLPNGKETRLEIIDHVGSVAMVPVDSERRIWFVRQYRHAASRELLELPAGTLEAGEQPETCAARELREEIGLAARELECIGAFFLAPGYATEYMHVFLARGLYLDPLPGDDDEFLRPETHPIQEVQAMLRKGVFQDSKTIAALALALPRLAGR